MKKRCLWVVLAIVLSLCACGGQEAEPAVEAPTWQEQYDLGIRYLSEGNYEEAIIAFTAAIEIDPKQAEAYIGLAEVYAAIGDTEKALDILNQAEEAAGPSDRLEEARTAVKQSVSPGAGTDEDAAPVPGSAPDGATLPETVRTQEIDLGAGMTQIREYDAQDHLIRMTVYFDGVLATVHDYMYPHAHPFLSIDYNADGEQTSLTHRIFSADYPSRILQETYTRSDEKLDVNYMVSLVYSGNTVEVQWQKTVVGNQDSFSSYENGGTAVHTLLSPGNNLFPLTVGDTISLAEDDPNDEDPSSLQVATYYEDGSLKEIREMQ